MANTYRPIGNVFTESARKLQALAIEHEAILVSYSGGKDSLVCADLCCKIFRRVVFFHMYFVPGLACVEQLLDYARDRWNVEILQYPHRAVYRCYKNGIFRPNHHQYDSLPDIGIHDLEAVIKDQTGIPIVAHGGKKSDSLWRRRSLSNTSHRTDRVYPVIDWNKWEVLSYLSANRIPVPQQDGTDYGTSSGIDLSTHALLWLHDNHPADFDLVERYFPFVRAVVRRRDWYGIDATRHRTEKLRSRNQKETLNVAT